MHIIQDNRYSSVTDSLKQSRDGSLIQRSLFKKWLIFKCVEFKERDYLFDAFFQVLKESKEIIIVCISEIQITSLFCKRTGLPVWSYRSLHQHEYK
jgi:hypothetical protein